MSEATLFGIISGVILLLMAIIGFLIRMWISSLEKRIEKLEEEIKAIKTNYLDKFEGVKDHVTAKLDEVKDLINGVKLNIAELGNTYMTKNECKYRHED